MQTTPATIDRGRRYHENPQGDWRINHERCNGVRDCTSRNHDDHQSGRAIRIALWREMPEPKQTLLDPTYRLATPSQRRRGPFGASQGPSGRVGSTPMCACGQQSKPIDFGCPCDRGRRAESNQFPHSQRRAIGAVCSFKNPKPLQLRILICGKP
jgi:hypothetical protein